MFRRKDYIYAVYEEKSFSKAAQKLMISQPSLSAIIKKTEEELGLPLFDRSTNPIGLTDFGKRYIQSVQQVNRLEGELENYVSDTNDLKRGSVVVGSGSHYVSYVLPQYVFQFMQAYPDVKLSLVETTSENLETRLYHEELDVILDNRELPSDQFEKCYFSTEYLLLAVPKSFPCNEKATPYRLSYEDILWNNHLDKRPVPFELFADVPFIMMTQKNSTRTKADMIFDHYHMTPIKTMELNQLSSAYIIASQGTAACFVSDTLIKTSGKATDNMYFYTFPLHLARRDVYFQYKKKKYCTKATSAFIKMCTEGKV